MTTASEKVSKMLVFTRLKILSVTLICEKAGTIKEVVPFIWHSDTCLESLSTSNCFILDKDAISPPSSYSLMINRNLTRLSLELGHICFAIVLIPFVPALEHFDLRLHKVYYEISSFELDFLEGREWPTKVKSLRLIAYDQIIDTTSFCAFVKRFSLSLKHLSFYIGTGQGFLIATRRTFELYLLDYLLHLKSIDFCVHSGLINTAFDRRHKFNNWTKAKVISIFHSQRKYLTRFTMPFSFDQLEHVSNDFLDYQYNHLQSNVILSLPSVVMITFDSYDGLNLALFTFIQQTCPSLRHLRFKYWCDLTDDLVQNTIFTLPTVTELCLRNVTYSIDFLILRRLLSLTPNLNHLTVQRDHLTVIDTMNNDINMLGHIIKVKIVERRSRIDNN